MSPFYTYVGVHSNKVVHRYVDERGKRHTDVVDYHPSLYLPYTDGEYQNIYKQPLKRKVFDSPNALRDFVREYRDVMKINGMDRVEYQFITEHYPERPIQFDFTKIKIINIDIETEVGNGFPDPDVAEQAITAITASIIGTRETFTWTTLDYEKAKDAEWSLDNHIYLCETEKELATRFLAWWNAECPDACTGWNIEGFDLPYITNRFAQLIGSETNKLSPIHDIAYRPVSKRPHPATGKDMIKVEGLAILDFLEVFKKFDFSSPPDYKLETIAQQVLGKGKVDYGEYDNIKDFYLGNPTKFVRYNIIDVLLVNEMEEVLKFIMLAYTLQYWSKCNTQDIFGQVRFWDIYIYNFLASRGIVVPPSKNIASFPLEGAFVAEPKLGLHKWVITLDLTSLYPMCIRQYNMGPETIIRGTNRHPGLLNSLINLEDIDEAQEAKRLKAALAANGAMFSKEQQSILSAVVDELFTNRVVFKKEMKQCERRLEEIKHEIHTNGSTPQLEAAYKECHDKIAMLDAQQMSMKIAINSLYGALGNEGFRYYDPSIAEAVTQSGQLAIQFIAKQVCEFLDKRLGIERGLERWLYSDTDSVFISLDDFVDQITNGRDIPTSKIVDIIDVFCKKEIEPFIQESYARLAEYMNAYENFMSMKREVIADRALFRAKKNYVMQVHDNEGVRYETPKLKMMGIETARSTTPQFVKDALVKTYKIMMNGENRELLDTIEAFKLEYMKASIDEISTPRGVNDMDKWIDASGNYKLRIPYHVKASHEFNRLLKQAGLKDMTPIQNGDKVRIISLLPSSPVTGNYIAYKGSLPKELGLHQYIDRETLFEKTFLSPVESFTKHIGWKHIDKHNVSDFFA